MYYFEEISKIPRGSGNIKAVSDYCKQFAENLQLEVEQDVMGNIIIKKPATLDKKDAPGVILQAHLDMVSEKTIDSTHDFEKQGLELQVKEGFISAKNTTLGADDGVGVAYALAILESQDNSHPNLEVIFTVDEEIGLLGAAGMELSNIKSKYLINLDSGEDSILWSGCAGGLTAKCSIPLQQESFTGIKTVVKINGLKGGHSGSEIDKERGNANVLLGRVLYRLKEICLYSIQDITGGLKDNAIPREAQATIILDYTDQYLIDNLKFDEVTEEYKKIKIQQLKDRVAYFTKMFKEEFKFSDPDVNVEIDFVGYEHCDTYNMVDSEKIVFFLMNTPNGVQNKSVIVDELVETSLNLGVLKIENNIMQAQFLVRSSVETRKRALSYRLKYLTEFIGGDYLVEGDYPGWEFKVDSQLRDTMVKVYEDMFGTTPEIRAIHAGLECGHFLQKCPWLDIISCGPNMYNIHTTEECLSVESTEKTYKYLLQVLKEIK